MSKRLNLTMSEVTYDLLHNHAKRIGLSEVEVIRNLIATHIKPEAQLTTTAKQTSQKKRVLTHEEKLFGMAKPTDDYSWLPSEDEMHKRRQALFSDRE